MTEPKTKDVQGQGPSNINLKSVCLLLWSLPAFLTIPSISYVLSKNYLLFVINWSIVFPWFSYSRNIYQFILNFYSQEPAN